MLCAEQSVVNRFWHEMSLFKDISCTIVVNQRFSLCCDCWCQVSDSSFKAVWILQPSKNIYGGVIDGVLNEASLFGTICCVAMKVLLQRLNTSENMVHNVLISLSWTLVFSVLSDGSVCVENAPWCQPANGLCRSQHCGNCG